MHEPDKKKLASMLSIARDCVMLFLLICVVCLLHSPATAAEVEVQADGLPPSVAEKTTVLTGTWTDSKSKAKIEMTEDALTGKLSARCLASPCWARAHGVRSAGGVGGEVNMTFEYEKDDGQVVAVPNIHARVSGCGARLEWFTNKALWVKDAGEDSSSYSETLAHVGKYHIIKECKHGKFILNHHDTWVSRSLKLYGEWSELELSVFLGILKEGDVVIDVGANIGGFTIPMAKKVGRNGMVYAFEPQRFLSQTLSANVVLNELPNVYTMYMALGDHVGTMKVPNILYNSPGNFGAVSLLKRYAASTALPMMTIDSLMLPCPRFIKIDAEGMEANILSGAKRTLKKCKPVLYVENNCVMGSEALIKLIDGAGYLVYWDLQPYFNENNYFNHEESIFPANMLSINMLAIAKSELNDGVRASLLKQGWVQIDIEHEKYYLSDYVFEINGENMVLSQNGNLTHCKR